MKNEKMTLQKIKASMVDLDKSSRQKNDLTEWFHKNEGVFREVYGDNYLKRFKKIKGDYQSELVISRYSEEYILKIYKTNLMELLQEIFHISKASQKNYKKNSKISLWSSKISKLLFPIFIIVLLVCTVIFFKIAN